MQDPDARELDSGRASCGPCWRGVREEMRVIRSHTIEALVNRAGPV